MKYLTHYIEQKQTDLFESTGAFFAFGQKQFEEKRQEGVIYVNLGHGLLCPKENVDEFIDRSKKIREQGIVDDIADNGAEGIIEREYFNYESQISMDTSEAKNALSGHIKARPDLFTEELIESVFSRCFNTAVANDWF